MSRCGAAGLGNPDDLGTPLDLAVEPLESRRIPLAKATGHVDDAWDRISAGKSSVYQARSASTARAR